MNSTPPDHAIRTGAGEGVDPTIDPDRRRLLQGLLAAGAAASTGCSQRPAHDALDIRDVARIDETRVAGIARPGSTEAVVAHLRDRRGPISIGGARYSMGGQIAAPGSLHLDMRGLNRLVHLNAEHRRVRVQAGMTWRDLQDIIDPHDLAVRVMQSYSNFSIGGSVSVNCHGRYVNRGALAGTIAALQLVTADGSVLELSRSENPALFAAAIGGYGGLGVITEVELDLDQNTRIERIVARVALEEYPAFFAAHVLGDPASVLHNADLAPPNFDQPLAITWRRSTRALTEPSRLVPRGLDYSRDQNLIWVASEFPSERVRDHYLTSRLLQEHAVVWRNHEASLDAASLEPRTRLFSTYLLQEYFIPVAAFASFAREMVRILHRFDVNALNVSIRHSPADKTSLMAWAPSEVFSFVLYYKQRQHADADMEARGWTSRMIEAALAHGGRYYLPYRLHATASQFLQAYPQAREFARIKHAIDPDGRFRNRLWNRYLPS